MAKSLILAVVDSVKIIATPGTSAAEKADSVFNLFGVTVTSLVVEAIFEAIEKGIGIPEFLLKPLQIIATVVCTNLTMLVLQKADLFDVRFGFKVESIRKLFKEERDNYEAEMQIASTYSSSVVDEIIDAAKEESRRIYDELLSLDPHKQLVRKDLESVSNMFGMNISFEAKWLEFLGISIT